MKAHATQSGLRTTLSNDLGHQKGQFSTASLESLAERRGQEGTGVAVKGTSALTQVAALNNEITRLSQENISLNEEL